MLTRYVIHRERQCFARRLAGRAAPQSKNPGDNRFDCSRSGSKRLVSLIDLGLLERIQRRNSRIGSQDSCAFEPSVKFRATEQPGPMMPWSRTVITTKSTASVALAAAILMGAALVKTVFPAVKATQSL